MPSVLIPGGYISCKSAENTLTIMPPLSLEINCWYRNNYLLANPDKFQCLTINQRRQDNGVKGGGLSIDSQEIMNNGTIKLLGINIDNELNFLQTHK